jgi:hypothetical protein
VDLSVAVDSGRINLIVTQLPTEAKLVLGPERRLGKSIAAQLEAIASDFPDLIDVVAGRKWIDRPFDWGDYK